MKNRQLNYWQGIHPVLVLGAAFIVLFVLLSQAKILHAKEANTQDSLTPVEKKIADVIVTARKTEENIQEVPVSMTVINQAGIEDMGVDSLVGLADFIPNLVLVSNGVSGMNSPSTRGMHGFIESLTLSTGLFVDGVPVLASTGFDSILLDIERVEVLRGPQGTLYGKNTESGAINIISRQPDNHFQGKICGELGEDNKKQVSLNLSGPLVDNRLFFGFAGQYREKDGYIENTYTGETENDKKHWYGKGQIRWTPSDDLDFSFIATSLRYDDKGNDMGLGELGALAFGLPAPEDYNVACDFPATNKSRINAQSLKVTYDFSKTTTLTSISTRRVFKDIATNDWDFNPVVLMHADKNSEYGRLSQEIRLDSSGDRFKWLAGFYYDKEDNDIYFTLDSIMPTLAQTQARNINGHSWASFGQLTWNLTDQLRLTGGLRYEEQSLELSDHLSGIHDDHSWGEISPKISFDYSFTPGVMCYASVSKGYRSGRFNTYSSNPDYLTFDEETLWSYEIGMKSVWFDNRLVVNTALFYMDINDMQVNEAVSIAESYVTNAAKASAMGVEIDMTAKISPSISLMANIGTSNVKFEEFQDSGGDYKDNKCPFAPEFTYSISAQYRNPNGLYARADLLGYGDMYFDKANQYLKPAHEIVNAKIGYEMDACDIYLYVNNLFDKAHHSYGFSDGLYTVYSEPRETGITVVYRF